MCSKCCIAATVRGEIAPSFAADYGFVTLTMASSSLAAGILSDRLGPTSATVAIYR
jgi:hypothetical protein